jgi:hypothetical protein
MKTNHAPTKVEKLIKLDYRAHSNEIWLTQQDTLRKLIGVSGMLLPFLLWFFLYVDNGHETVLPSISHYYFTRVSGVFVIIVSLLAIFLLVYKGEDPIDFFLSSAAGVFALSLVLFPTGNLTETCKDENFPYSVSILRASAFREKFHYLSAAIFLGCLAAMAGFLFTKSDKPPSKRGIMKKRRNRVFRVCAVVMALAMLTAFAGYLRWIPEDFYDKHHLTYWMEAVAIEAFGISWLVKGEAVLKD